MQVSARPGAALQSSAVLPLSDDEFTERMARFAPFEAAPTVAVAVSGGRDSMSLALLASRWAKRLGGAVVALTVDHGLRPDSASEARQVAKWLGGHDIRHKILYWPGPYPASGIQAAARQARYRLLTEYCHDHAILHLLVGHHREDQAETVLIRLEGHSGPDGLAAMAPLSERRHLRLLRPLLEEPRDRLTSYLTAVGQPWIDDPSNDNTQMARGRLRAPDGRLASAYALAEALSDARTYANDRILAERATATLAAQALRFHTAGYITIDRAVLASAAPDIVERVLVRSLMAVAGRRYPPRGLRTRRLRDAVISADGFSGRTLAGCRLVEHQNSVHVCREPARIGSPINLVAGVRQVWDSRFLVSVTKNLGEQARLDALTARGWKQIIATDPQLRMTPMPYAARTVLPAVWQGEQVVAVPHLAYVRAETLAHSAGLRLKWLPQQAVAPAPFGKV